MLDPPTNQVTTVEQPPPSQNPQSTLHPGPHSKEILPSNVDFTTKTLALSTVRSTGKEHPPDELALLPKQVGSNPFVKPGITASKVTVADQACAKPIYNSTTNTEELIRAFLKQTAAPLAKARKTHKKENENEDEEDEDDDDDDDTPRRRPSIETAATARLQKGSTHCAIKQRRDTLVCHQLDTTDDCTDPTTFKTGGAPNNHGTRQTIFSGDTHHWWTHFVDFVPVRALQTGMDPRDNSIVHINYLKQFSSESTTDIEARKARKDVLAANQGARAGDIENKEKGYWTTNSQGRRVYTMSGGCELLGKNAYRQYQKDSGKTPSSPASSAGGRRRKNRKKR